MINSDGQVITEGSSIRASQSQIHSKGNYVFRRRRLLTYEVLTVIFALTRTSGAALKATVKS